MFDFMYKTDKIKEALGSHWCGPSKLEHGKEVKIAHFKKVMGDGQDVEVYCMAMPAQFFVVKALEDTNSVGELMGGFKLSTGSGMLSWCIEAAKNISEGMVGLAK